MIAPLLLLLFGQADSRALLRQGLEALQQNRLSDAETALTSAAESDPRNPIAWASLTQVEWRLGHAENAARDAKKAEEFGGNKPAIAHALAIYYAESNQPARAGDLELKNAESTHSSAAFAQSAAYFLAAGADLKAQDAAVQGVQLDPNLTFDLANAFLHREKFDGAAEILLQGLQSRPSDPQLLLALGVARYGQRRFDDAITQFIATIKADASIPQPYEYLGRMLDQAGSRLQEITALFRVHAGTNPSDPQATLQLAKALLAADPTSSESETLLRNSIAHDSTNWESHYELGALLESKRAYPEAASELERAAELRPAAPEPHYHLARVYARLNQPDKAAEQRAIHARLTASPQH